MIDVTLGRSDRIAWPNLLGQEVASEPIPQLPTVFEDDYP